MKQRKKRLGIWMILLAILLLGQYIVPVKASASEITDANIQMVGGQIRTITPMGLRMIGCIKKSYIQELEQNGATVQYGIVLLPKVYLGNQELKIDGKYLYNGSVYKAAKVPAVKKFAEKDDRIYFTAVLANLAKERYKNDYAARAYVEITRSVEQEDGSSKNETEILYSDNSIDRQVYQVAKDAVNGTVETEENKQWIKDNVLNPIDNPESIPEADKKIPFQLGKVSGVTLYQKSGDGTSTASVEEVSRFTLEGFKPDEYLVKVEMEDQPEVFAEISEVITSDSGQVHLKLKLDNYITKPSGQTAQGAIVEFGTVSEGEASTKYITMQSLIDKINDNPSGTYTLEHDIDASAVQGEDCLIPEFSGTFDGKGYKIKGLTTTLFGKVSGGTVKDVKLENVSITKNNSYGDAGGGTIANKAENNAVIEGVHVSGSLKSNNSRELLGGLVGRMDYAKVSKCSTNLEITGSFNTTGGLIGQMSNQDKGPNIVENSYAVGSISGNKTNGAIGGLIGWHNCKTKFSVTNCYAAVTLKVSGTGNGMEPGGFIGNIGASDATGTLKNSVSYSNGTPGYKFDGASTADKYNVQGISELYALKESKLKTRATQLTKISEVSVDELLEKEFYTKMGWDEDIWDFAPLKEGKTPVLKNGDSNMTTMLEMKEISSVEELQKIKDDLSGVYSLTADLDVSEVKTSNNVIIPGTFKGMLKGNGHQIIGQKAPLFATLNGATVENLKLTQGKIEQKSTDQVAVLAKTAEAGTTIKNVYVRDMTVAGRSSVAGMVAVLKNTTVDECSVNATVNGQKAGGFAAEILENSVISNSYAKRTADQNEFGTTNAPQGGFAAVVKKSQLIKNFGELSWSVVEKEEAPTAVNNVGNFIGESGVGQEAPTKVEKNISFGPAAYSFAGNLTAETGLDTYTGNYEYADLASSQDDVTTSKLNGKIDKASADQIISKDFYLTTLSWDEKIWYLEDVAGGKRPRLLAEGDVYGLEDKPSSEEVVYLEAAVQSDVLEESQEEPEKPEEIIRAIEARTIEEAAAFDSLENISGYDPKRKQIYENLRLFMPFYHREQIVKDGNQVDVSHPLNKAPVLAVYPMDAQGNRIVALSDETVENVKKLRIQFTDNTITPLIYNISYIDTRENIASYKVSQIPVHFNFKNYVVNTKTPQFQTLLNAAKEYTFDKDIETRVSQRDSDSVLNVYRRNFDEVVKKEMEQVLVAMAATNPQYPMNSDSAAAEKIVTDTFITSEYLKDFLYAYNYVDRWYDFQIGGINLRDVVIFDNSILKTDKPARSLPTEIVKISSSDGRQGNKTPFFYVNRISSYTGIDNIASFVEYFMTAYAGYSDVNDWIIDNFQGGIIVEARANNPKINSRLWRILKNNTVQKNNELILPVLSYKTSKNLYLASFPSSLVYGNLEIYGGYQDTEQWRQQKKQQIISQVNDFKTSYDNFAEVASNGAESINNSKFLIVDSSAKKNHNQDVFKEFYRPLQTLWQSNNGAVAVIFGNPNHDYIYYNSSNFIGDLTVLNHEMGHVTDMWIWMENKGKRPGRNGEDYSNGFANQANVDYNMNFMKTYSRDSSMVTNLTPDRINSQEEFKSYYKEVFETIYTLDYLQGKAYLELTPAQQARITLQHRYGTTNNYQNWNNSNSTWRTIGAAELENMNLKTLDDLWNNQLTIRPGHRYELRSVNDVGVNNLGAYQIDRVCFASWYVPYVNNGTPNAQTFRRNGYELAGMYGYSDGLVEYLSGKTRTNDLEYFKKKTENPDFSFESYRKNKNVEIQEKIAKQKLQENPYFDEEALIEYLKQNMINPGNPIDSGASNLGNTLNNIKESRENVFRYLQRITDEFRSPVYGEANTRNAVTISTAEEFIEKITANPNGFYVLENDISLKDIPLNNNVYINKTFIGKLEGNGHKITNAKGPLFAKITNSYISDLSILNEAGDEMKDWIGAQRPYIIRVNEKKEETVKPITSLDELKTLGENKYTKYVLKNNIDASSITEATVIKGTFKGKLDGGNFAITGLKVPLFEKVDDAAITNLKIKDVEINNQGSKNAAITKESNHTTFENLNLENIQISGESYNAAISGYDYTGSTFSKIQIRKAQISGTKNYNAAFVGRASGSDISDVAVIGSKVTLSGTDCGGFIGEGKNLNIHHVYSDSDIHVETYTDSQNRTNSAGFIGNLAGKSNVEYVFAAGTVNNKTEKELYNFLGTPNVLETMVNHAFIIENADGKSNITDATGERLATVTVDQTKQTDFYRTSMNLSETIWNLSLVGMKGYPELLGMEKMEVISVSTAKDFLKMKDFPTQEYHLEADIDLSNVEQTEALIPQFSGVLDGKNHTVTGLKVPLFGEMNGKVSKLAIANNQLEINIDTEAGVFANQMTGAAVEKVLIYNSKINNTAGKATGFVGTINNSTLKNIFVHGEVHAKSMASGFVLNANGSTIENIYTNVQANGTEGAGFVVSSTGKNTYTNICSVGDVSANMYKLSEDITQITNGYEFAAANGMASSKENSSVKNIGKEVWTKDFYTTTLGLDLEVWDAEQAESNGYPSLKDFKVQMKPMRVEIHTSDDVQKMNRVPEGKFVLTADLNFEGTDNSLVTETFTGILNGENHAVSGINSAFFQILSGTVENLQFRNILVENENAGANVLAVETKNATVKNVHFNGITLRGAGYTGIIGKDTHSTFNQISMQNVDMTANKDYAGVLAANASQSQMTDILVAETQVKTSSSYVGGLIGKANAVSVQKAFVDAELNIPYTVSPANTAAFIGLATENSKISYSTVAGGVYPEDPSTSRYKLMYMKSSDLNELKPFTNCFINIDTPGYDSVGGDLQGIKNDNLLTADFYSNSMQLNSEVWDWSKASQNGYPGLKTMPTEGIRPPGTEVTPEEETPLQQSVPEGYQAIQTAEELLAIRDGSGKYILMNSISLYGKKAQDGSFLGNFKGELDGNGLTIREIYGAPLFNNLSGIVNNLKVSDVKVEAWNSNQSANAIAKTLNGARISRLALKNILVAGGDYTGALAGTAQNSTVSEVWAEGLNVNPYGPLFGQNSDRMVGGLIAYLNGGCHISDSYVGGEITVNGKYQGGVIGYSEYDTSNTVVKQVVSNMRTKATSNQTNGSGFIGIVQMNYDMQTWIENSIAIGEAGADKKQGSIGEAYRFTATTGASMQWSLSNCYQAKVSGKSNISSGSLEETTEYKNPDFYRNKLKFDRTKWNFADVEKNGYPTLIWIAGEEPLPPLPQGSEVKEHPLRTTNPSGYTEIRTPADFMKIADDPSGKYILMNNISLEQVRLPEGQTSYIMKEFKGELDGNNQVIHGLRASLFDFINGTTSKKATIKNLRIQNVFVDAGYKNTQMGRIRAEANGLAREIIYGNLNSIYMNVVKLNGGNNTAALGGTVKETYIGKVWLEGIDINSNIKTTELEGFNLIGGAVARLSGYNSKFEDSYVSGNIIMDNNQQGGAVGEVEAAIIRNVVSNMEARSNKPANWRNKSGFLGTTSGRQWILDRCISIGNAGANYKFLGKILVKPEGSTDNSIQDITTDNLRSCYEYTSATGTSNVSDITISRGTLLTTDDIHNIAFYKDTLNFNESTLGADPNAWDFGTVTTKGYPTLTWLLTYDNLPTTPVEEPLPEETKDSENPETVSKEEAALPEQEENPNENAEKNQDDETETTPKEDLEKSEITRKEKEEDMT